MVEIAIVLVIIGLLLGGILKGQELINSARAACLTQTPAFRPRTTDSLTDSRPYTGDFRATVPVGGGAVFGDMAMTEAECIDSTNRVWDVTRDAQSCNGVYLF